MSRSIGQIVTKCKDWSTCSRYKIMANHLVVSKTHQHQPVTSKMYSRQMIAHEWNWLLKLKDRVDARQTVQSILAEKNVCKGRIDSLSSDKAAKDDVHFFQTRTCCIHQHSRLSLQVSTSFHCSNWEVGYISPFSKKLLYSHQFGDP